MLIPLFPKQVGVFAAQQLSNIDYSFATHVSEDVSKVIEWSYDNDMWWISQIAIQILESFDNLGSLFISIVVWIIHHTV